MTTLDDFISQVKKGITLPQDIGFGDIGGSGIVENPTTGSGGASGGTGGVFNTVGTVLGSAAGVAAGTLGGGGTSASTTCSGIGFFFSPSCWVNSAAGAVGNQLLRIVLLILGLLCVAGAIYLYKGPGSQIVSIPARAVGNAARAVASVGSDA